MTPAGRPLLIFPCNGNGIEALDCLGDVHHCIGFVDDTPSKQGSRVHGIAVYGRAVLAERPEVDVLAVPGSPVSYPTRREVIRGLGLAETRLARVVHPSARVSPLARLGHNVLVMAGVVITANAVIGDHVCILPNTVIHHDVTVGDWTLVGSNVTLAGGVVVEENAYIGSGTSVMNGVRIGARALVGLGSNVIRNVTAESTVAGNPARVIGSVRSAAVTGRTESDRPS